MDNFQLLFESPPWLILFCLLAGAVYAYLQYQPRGPWSTRVNQALAGIRFLLVTILGIILLSPFIKQIRNLVEPPSLVIAIDNSTSVREVEDSLALYDILEELSQVTLELEKQDFAVEVRTLYDKDQPADISLIRFDYPITDVNRLLTEIQSDYEGRNLGGVILMSDGIYNQGISPQFVPYSFRIHTIGLGDTLPKTDLNLQSVLYNKLAYQGNRYPLKAEILNTGFNGEEIVIEVLKGNDLLDSKKVLIEGTNELNEVSFFLDADQKGIQHLVVRVVPKTGEYTYKNNAKHAYVDVVEGKEKILMVANNPHPDIKAVKSAIEKNENYEFHQFIPGIDQFEDDKYDLVIFHQFPDRQNLYRSYMERLMANNPSVWYIVGTQSNLRQLNAINSMVTITPSGNLTDQVFPVFNQGFERFGFDPELQKTLREYSPATVPFGKYEILPETEVILYQKVGAIETRNPLLVIKVDGDRKTGLMLGEGLWQWRLQEYASNLNQRAFDELISKLVQFLSSKEDKRKFKIYPVKNDIFTNESVVFETETYNDVYEKFYGNKVELIIEDEDGIQSEYSFTPSEFNSQYHLSGLDQGIYRYTATTRLSSGKKSSSGEFTVNELLIEALNLTADHQLLRTISHQTLGQFFKKDQISLLQESLLSQKAQGIIHTQEEFLPIINLKWLLILLVVLVSTEWFVRKYLGSY